MKKYIITLAAVASLSATSAFSQSAIDALQLTQRDFKGTARFMGMGGAFTALGGDLSAIGQNPGGIGIYRSSEIGATLDIDIQNSKGKTSAANISNNQTVVNCNNFGYVGTINFNSSSALQTFSWGVTYNRRASFDRKVGAYAYPVGTSLTNYIAALTQGINAADLEFYSDYNPYYDSGYDWLSILGYNSYLINNINGSNTLYQGLYGQGTDSDADIFVQEKGYVDDYKFTFGGNFSNLIYWGVGFGVTDMRYHRFTSYSESMANANIYYNNQAGSTQGSAEYWLDNNKLIKGTGWNLSFGLIIKPIQELRIGAAIHSPTWYAVDESHVGSVDYNYTYNDGSYLSNSEYTDEAYFSWKLRSPWKFNVGVAGVIGGKAIISADYEREMFNDMTIQTSTYNNWGFENNNALNDNIKQYAQAANTIRLGAEFRATPNFSLRVGYNCQLTNIRSAYLDQPEEVLTASTDPSYSFDKTTSYYTAGLGWQVKNFYADLTYAYKDAKSDLHPYTSYADVVAPSFEVSESNSSIVLSLGFKF